MNHVDLHEWAVNSNDDTLHRIFSECSADTKREILNYLIDPSDADAIDSVFASIEEAHREEQAERTEFNIELYQADARMDDLRAEQAIEREGL